MNCQDYKEIVAAHVDGTLAAEELAAVEGHIKVCAGCRRMYAWEREAKAVLKRRLGIVPARAALRQRVLEGLPQASAGRFWGWSYMPHGVVAAFAVLLLLVLPYLSWRGEPRLDLFTDAIAHYQKVTQGAAGVEAGAVSLTPTARLLDLSPWGYRALARQKQEVGGLEARVFVYQGAQREYLLAQEFEGAEFTVPSGAKAIRAAGREFVGYSEAGVNLVAWKEKDMVCIIASSLPQERLFQLAQQITRAS